MKFKFKKIKDFLEKIPRILVENLFLFFLLLLFSALIFGGLVFYKYYFLIEKTEPEVFRKPLYFKENLLKEILKEWEKREKNLEIIELKEYPDPFRVPEKLTD